MKEKTFKGKDINGNTVDFTVIATFDLNGRHYLFYTDMTNMYVGYYECKKVKSITDVAEYTLLSSLYEQLKVNNFKHEFYDYGYTFYNGKNYKMIYDNYNRKRYFFELVNNRYQEVKDDILEHFNKKFNSEVISLNDSLNLNKTDEFNNKTRRVKVNLMNNLLNIIVNTNIKFTNIPLVQNVLEDTEELNYNESIDSPQRIKQYISSNNLLDIKDKAFLLSLDELYNDNYKYMDNENLKNRLPNLAIIYNKISQNNDDSVSGEYYPKDNKIMLYKYDSFNEDNYDTELHEYMHALSNTGLTYDNPDGLALTEGITEFITSEYLDTFDKRKYIGSYRKQQVYAKMLCEILGKDSILEAYYKHDYNILIDELNKYSDKEEESIDLLRLINDEYKYEEELGSEAFKDEITSKNKVYKDIQNKIDLLYAKMFEKAKNYPMENDKIMCSYLDQIRKGNRANYELYQEGNTYYTEVKKNYINSNKDLTNTTIKYYYANKIAIKPDNTSFLLQGDGRYLYIDSNNERMYFDNIPEYILTDCINNEVTEENRKLNQKNR